MGAWGVRQDENQQRGWMGAVVVVAAAGGLDDDDGR